MRVPSDRVYLKSTHHHNSSTDLNASTSTTPTFPYELPQLLLRPVTDHAYNNTSLHTTKFHQRVVFLTVEIPVVIRDWIVFRQSQQPGPSLWCMSSAVSEVII